jgi:hypothetical protein
MKKRLKEAPGGRLRGSTGTSDLGEAQRYLARKIEGYRNAAIYGIRPVRTFDEAAGHYLLWNKHKASLQHDDIVHLKALIPFIGHLRLEQVHMGTDFKTLH